MRQGGVHPTPGIPDCYLALGFSFLHLPASTTTFFFLFLPSTGPGRAEKGLRDLDAKGRSSRRRRGPARSGGASARRDSPAEDAQRSSGSSSSTARTPRKKVVVAAGAMGPFGHWERRESREGAIQARTGPERPPCGRSGHRSACASPKFQKIFHLWTRLPRGLSVRFPAPHRYSDSLRLSPGRTSAVPRCSPFSSGGVAGEGVPPAAPAALCPLRVAPRPYLPADFPAAHVRSESGVQRK